MLEFVAEGDDAPEIWRENGRGGLSPYCYKTRRPFINTLVLPSPACHLPV